MKKHTLALLITLLLVFAAPLAFQERWPRTIR